MSDSKRKLLITTKDAARLLGVSEDSVRMLYARGRLTRYGSRWRRMADLDEVQQIHAEWNPSDAEQPRTRFDDVDSA